MIQKILIGLVVLMCGVVNAAENTFAGALMTNADGSVSDGVRSPVPPPPGNPGNNTFFDWGRGNDGTGYCYQFTWDGYVMNGGAAQPNYYCEQVRPSHFDWGRGNNGYGYCYQFTPYNLVMNKGAAQSNMNCERYYPSHYRWANANDGRVYCFQFTPYGLAMNDGRPVPPQYCY